VALDVPGAVAFAAAVPVDCCCDCVELTSGLVLDGVATEELADEEELAEPGMVLDEDGFCAAVPAAALLSGGVEVAEADELGVLLLIELELLADGLVADGWLALA